MSGAYFQSPVLTSMAIKEKIAISMDGALLESLDAKIDGYPTWEFADGTRRDGFVPLADLARISNCSLG